MVGKCSTNITSSLREHSFELIPSGMDRSFPSRSSLEQREYEYLLSLPLVLHIPSIHTFTVHAGILASDISRPATDRIQPLAHYPTPTPSSPATDETSLRLWQESAVLNDIPQNNDPWVLLNMRSILKDKTISR
jgi:hypothetical protein